METSHTHIFVLRRSSPTAFLLKTPSTFSATQQTETLAAHRHLRHLATAISPELSKVVCEGLTANNVTPILFPSIHSLDAPLSAMVRSSKTTDSECSGCLIFWGCLVGREPWGSPRNGKGCLENSFLGPGCKVWSLDECWRAYT